MAKGGFDMTDDILDLMLTIGSTMGVGAANAFGAGAEMGLEAGKNVIVPKVEEWE